MYSRLAFATAIQVDPDILIIDESIQVGDMGFQKKCLETIKNFKEDGKSIILVAHDMAQIKQSCDSVIFLNNGRIEKQGEPNEVISSYTESFNV